MIVITGATGRTGRVATQSLLAKGEKVRAVARDPKKLAPLADLGAEPFVAHVENSDSVTTAFAGASAVYLVLPEDLSQPDLRTHQNRVSDSYAAAITYTRVRGQARLGTVKCHQVSK